MKVGIVHTAYLHHGGEDSIVQSDIECLQNNAVEVSTLFFQNPKNKLKQLSNLFLSAFNYRSYKTAVKWMEEEKPDVVHIHNWHYSASPSVIAAANKKGVPIVHTLHNFRLVCPSAVLLHNKKLFLDSIYAGFPWKAVSKRVYRNSYLQTFLLAFTVWLNKKLGTWKKVNKYIALTQNAKNIFVASTLNLDDSKIAVKPNYITDVKPLQKTKRNDEFLFVGRLSEEKGVQLLLDVFSKSKYTITIIGEGPLLDAAKAFAVRHNNIKVAGFKERDCIINALHSYTALIVPSLWFEGNPLTIIEAFACGTPVIASKLGAMESMITNNYNGLHFQPGNEQSLAEVLAKWQTISETEKNNFNRNARNTYLKNHTPEKNTETLMKIYKSVIDGKEEFV